MTTSWVIVRHTGEVVMETFDPKLVKLVNTKVAKAVPIMEYLQSLNAQVRT